MTRYSALSIGILLVSFEIGRAQEIGQSRTYRHAAAVDDTVTKLVEEQGLVGVAIGVIENGKIAYVNGYGLADREKKIPVSAKTVFNWASNSKPIAAVAAMQLFERGLLDLDADVRTYVPQFPEKPHKISMRQILSHASGIPHYMNGKVVPIKLQIGNHHWTDPMFGLQRFGGSPLVFEPGTKVAYSSYAYVLASAVIQAAGKQPFAKQITTRISEPLAMTSFQWDDEFKNQPHWAVGYVRPGNGPVTRTPEEAHGWKHGAGGFKSNIVDFARWAAALTDDTFLSPKCRREMWTNQIQNGKPTSWGLGFSVNRSKGLRVSHGGSQSETKTHMFVYPEAKWGVVVMSNCNFANPAAIAAAIGKTIAEK